MSYTITMAEVTLNRAWLVLAIVLILFFVGIFIDRIVAAVVPTYVGLFNDNPFMISSP